MTSPQLALAHSTGTLNNYSDFQEFQGVVQGVGEEEGLGLGLEGAGLSLDGLHGLHADSSLLVLGAVLAVILSPLILCGNLLLLGALYRFKRLRTPSNYLLASLASSDLGVGLFLPVVMYQYLELQLTGAAGVGAARVGAQGPGPGPGPTQLQLQLHAQQHVQQQAGAQAGAQAGVQVGAQVQAQTLVQAQLSALPLCALPYCLLTGLCCASLLVMAAIAVDRFTSLAQPLRYNNLITHRSVERYIAALWLYAGLVACAPLVARVWWGPEVAAGGGRGWDAEGPPPPPCSGASLLRPPGVVIFLMCSVYLPCAALVVGCYAYVYLVARTHHRAIYSVEISLRPLRHTQDAPSRYTSTLAITVGLFVCLWLPFQVALIADLVQGHDNLTSWWFLFLSLPMFASSALNPWVYGYRNSEVRTSVLRVLEELLAKLGLSSPHIGCPHLVTTGVDAELNSFASNMRLCTVSVSPMRTTLLLLPSGGGASNMPSEVNSTGDLAVRETVIEIRTPETERNSPPEKRV